MADRTVVNPTIITPEQVQNTFLLSMDGQRISLDDILRALVDLTDGESEHDLVAQTGLLAPRAQEILDLARKLPPR